MARRHAIRILLRDGDHELIQREPPVFRAAVICNKPRALDGVGKPVVEVPPATTTIRQTDIIYIRQSQASIVWQCGAAHNVMTF